MPRIRSPERIAKDKINFKAWYRKNHEKHKANVSKRQKDNIKAMQAKKVNPCTDCKKKYHPVCMDFDHVRGIKSGNIATIAKYKSRVDLEKELKKCQLVCSNCHRLRTHKRLMRTLKNRRKRCTRSR